MRLCIANKTSEHAVQTCGLENLPILRVHISDYSAPLCISENTKTTKEIIAIKNFCSTYLKELFTWG
jgi:hypothetical protein